MGKIIVAANQKGGVTKTTVCQHLAYELAAQRHRVLCVDFDSQVNLTVSLARADAPMPQLNMNDLLTLLLEDQEPPPAHQYIAHSGGVDFIPGSKELYRQESALLSEMGSERFLASILAPLRTSYDYILIDTNRANSPLMVNALTAADSVLIPVCPEFYSTEGLSDLVTTVLKNKRRLNPSLTFEGIVFSKCDLRTNLYRETRADVEEAFRGDIPVFKTPIPRTVQVEEAIRRGMTVLEYAPDSKVSAAFRALTKEVMAHAEQSTRAQTSQDDGAAYGECRRAG